jgi:hypothetical protein
MGSNWMYSRTFWLVLAYALSAGSSLSIRESRHAGASGELPRGPLPARTPL